MFDRPKSEFERAISAGLRPTEAPDSLWSRVESGLHPRPARTLAPVALGLALAFSLTAAWFSGLPQPPRAELGSSCQPTDRRGWTIPAAPSAHAKTVRVAVRQECVGCHVGVVGVM